MLYVRILCYAGAKIFYVYDVGICVWALSCLAGNGSIDVQLTIVRSRQNEIASIVPRDRVHAAAMAGKRQKSIETANEARIV